MEEEVQFTNEEIESIAKDMITLQNIGTLAIIDYSNEKYGVIKGANVYKVFSDSGEFVGKAFDVKVKDKREYLAIENSSLKEELITLDTILRVEVLTPNARFKKVEFR